MAGPAARTRSAVGAAGLVQAADRIQLMKYVIHQVAASYGKAATFMPKPVADEPGSGLNVHQALWRDGKPTFAGQGYADLSHDLPAVRRRHHAARTGAQRVHQPDHQQLQAPAARPDEPTLMAYAAHNRSAAIRIPYAARPERSGSRSASPTRPPIPTWPSPRS